MLMQVWTSAIEMNLSGWLSSRDPFRFELVAVALLC